MIYALFFILILHILLNHTAAFVFNTFKYAYATLIKSIKERMKMDQLYEGDKFGKMCVHTKSQTHTQSCTDTHTSTQHGYSPYDLSVPLLRLQSEEMYA